MTTSTPSATGLDAGAQMLITVRYFAGARAAAGVEQEGIALPAGAALPELSRMLAELHGPDLARVLTASSWLIDEVAGAADRAIPAGATVDVLPPFAGG